MCYTCGAYRLGEAEKATYHYKHSGPEADQEDLAKVRSLQALLNKCTEARRLRDWNTLIKETRNVIAAGADSAPQVSLLNFKLIFITITYQSSIISDLMGENQICIQNYVHICTYTCTPY